MRNYLGMHFLAGRFIPKSVALSYELESLLSLYKGSSEYVRLS
jgi:hypothetical protein